MAVQGFKFEATVMQSEGSTVLITRGEGILTEVDGTIFESSFVLKDSLAFGPSSLDPKRHLQLRQDYWRGITASSMRKVRVNLPKNDDGYFQFLNGANNFVYMLNQDPNDALELIRLCSCLKVGVHGLSVVWCKEDTHFDCNQIASLAEQAELISADERIFYSECWRAFCEGELTRLGAFAENAHPLLNQSITELLDAMIPRYPRSRSGQLSRIDIAVLSPLLHGRPMYSFEIVAGVCTKFPWVPELCVFARLVDWEPMALRCKGGRSWNRLLYELTETGKAIVRGECKLIAPPHFPIGGTDAYSSAG